jgi:hypothetical protein
MIPVATGQFLLLRRFVMLDAIKRDEKLPAASPAFPNSAPPYEAKSILLSLD